MKRRSFLSALLGAPVVAVPAAPSVAPIVIAEPPAPGVHRVVLRINTETSCTGYGGPLDFTVLK